MKTAPKSLLVIGFLCVLMLAARLWKPNQKPISWDVGGYYLYLPAQFIYHDLGLNDYHKFDSLRIKYDVSSTFYQVHETPNGKRITKYTMGNSILYAPFFLIGHASAWALDYPMDGYSAPYQQALYWGMFVYVFLALFFARKILLFFFTDKVTSLTLLAIVLGTNLFQMVSMDNLQIHFSLFFLYTLFIWSTIRYHQAPNISKAIVMGFWGGLIILTRPTDIVSWAIPICWGVQSFNDIKIKIRLQYKYFMVFFFVAAIVFFPQLLYWKIYAGEWFYNSYDNAGEGLDLLRPHTFPFLLSYRKGWFVYTPMAILMLFGIFISIKSRTKIFISLVIFFLLTLWIASSWTCWWYANSFSSRAMIQSYVVLMIPLGFLIQYISSKRFVFSIVGKTIIGVLVLFCMFQTWQYSQRILKFDRMTKAYYWRAFGAITVDPQNDQYLLKDKLLETDTIPDPENFKATEEYDFDFNHPKNIDTNQLIQVNGDHCLKLDSSRIFFTILEECPNKMTSKYYAYVRVEGELMNTAASIHNPVELVREMKHNGKTYAYSAKTLFKNDTLSKPVWRSFKMDYIFPDIRNPMDQFRTYFWLRGKDPVYIKNLRVKVIEAKKFPELE